MAIEGIVRYSDLASYIPKGSFYSNEGTLIPYYSSARRFRLEVPSPGQKYAVYINELYSGETQADPNGNVEFSKKLPLGEIQIKLVDKSNGRGYSTYLTSRNYATWLAGYATGLEEVDDNIQRVYDSLSIENVQIEEIEENYGTAVETYMDFGSIGFESYRHLVHELRLSYRNFGGRFKGLEESIAGFTQVPPYGFTRKKWGPNWFLGSSLVNNGKFTERGHSIDWDSGGTDPSIDGVELLKAEADLTPAGGSPHVLSYNSTTGNLRWQPDSTSDYKNIPATNGELFLPGGNHSKAAFVTSVAGPFSIVNGGGYLDVDHLYLDIDQKGIIDITVTTGASVTASTLASDINTALNGDTRYGASYASCAASHLTDYLVIESPSASGSSVEVLHGNYNSAGIIFGTAPGGCLTFPPSLSDAIFLKDIYGTSLGYFDAYPTSRSQFEVNNSSSPATIRWKSVNSSYGSTVNVEESGYYTITDSLGNSLKCYIDFDELDSGTNTYYFRIGFNKKDVNINQTKGIWVNVTSDNLPATNQSARVDVYDDSVDGYVERPDNWFLPTLSATSTGVFIPSEINFDKNDEDDPSPYFGYMVEDPDNTSLEMICKIEQYPLRSDIPRGSAWPQNSVGHVYDYEGYEVKFSGWIHNISGVNMTAVLSLSFDGGDNWVDSSSLPLTLDDSNAYLDPDYVEFTHKIPAGIDISTSNWTDSGVLGKITLTKSGFSGVSADPVVGVLSYLNSAVLMGISMDGTSSVRISEADYISGTWTFYDPAFGAILAVSRYGTTTGTLIVDSYPNPPTRRVYELDGAGGSTYRGGVNVNSIQGIISDGTNIWASAQADDNVRLNSGGTTWVNDGIPNAGSTGDLYAAVYHNGTIYFGDSDSPGYCYKRTGAGSWSTEFNVGSIGPSTGISRLETDGTLLWVGDNQGNVYTWDGVSLTHRGIPRGSGTSRARGLAYVSGNMFAVHQNDPEVYMYVSGTSWIQVTDQATDFPTSVSARDLIDFNGNPMWLDSNDRNTFILDLSTMKVIVQGFDSEIKYITSKSLGNATVSRDQHHQYFGELNYVWSPEELTLKEKEYIGIYHKRVNRKTPFSGINITDISRDTNSGTGEFELEYNSSGPTYRARWNPYNDAWGAGLGWVNIASDGTYTMSSPSGSYITIEVNFSVFPTFVGSMPVTKSKSLVITDLTTTQGHTRKISPAYSTLDVLDITEYNSSGDPVNLVGPISEGDFSSCTLTNCEVFNGDPFKFGYVSPSYENQEGETLIFAPSGPNYQATLNFDTDQDQLEAILYEDGLPVPNDEWSFISSTTVQVIGASYNSSATYTLDYNLLYQIESELIDLGANYTDYAWFVDYYLWERFENTKGEYDAYTPVYFNPTNGRAFLEKSSTANKSTARLIVNTGQDELDIAKRYWRFVSSNIIEVDLSQLVNGQYYLVHEEKRVYEESLLNITFEHRSAATSLLLPSATYRTVEKNENVSSEVWPTDTGHQYHQLRMSISNIRDLRDFKLRSMVLKGLHIHGSSPNVEGLTNVWSDW